MHTTFQKNDQCKILDELPLEWPNFKINKIYQI